MEGINLIGSAMKERFARENKPGVLSYTGYDAWWNGGLRSVPAFHNMHGILTETALFGYATPGEYKLKRLSGALRQRHSHQGADRVLSSAPGWAARGACATRSTTCSPRTSAILDLAVRAPRTVSL